MLDPYYSLASALSSVSDHAGIIRTVKHRFDERREACTDLARATEEARAEKENREQLNRAQSDRESSLRHEVMHPQLRPCVLGVPMYRKEKLKLTYTRSLRTSTLDQISYLLPGYIIFEAEQCSRL